MPKWFAARDTRAHNPLIKFQLQSMSMHRMDSITSYSCYITKIFNALHTDLTIKRLTLITVELPEPTQNLLTLRVGYVRYSSNSFTTLCRKSGVWDRREADVENKSKSTRFFRTHISIYTCVAHEHQPSI